MPMYSESINFQLIKHFHLHRPHPNECSGSDLDGDVYFVCWDQELIPPRQIEAMDYTAAEIIRLDHDVTIEVLLCSSKHI